MLKVKARRGLRAALLRYTGHQGELAVAVDSLELFYYDGIKEGGYLLTHSPLQKASIATALEGTNDTMFLTPAAVQAMIDTRINLEYAWKSMAIPIHTSDKTSTSLWKPNYRMTSLSHNKFKTHTFSIVLPSDYKEGTPVHPHLHWTTNASRSGRIRLGVEYFHADGYTNDTFAPSSLIYKNIDVSSSDNNKHMALDLPDDAGIYGLDLKPGSVLIINLFRDLDNDWFSSHMYLMSAGLHYQIGRLGSSERHFNG